MAGIETWLARNRVWAEQVRQRNPGAFRELARGQQPEMLWIGCSDSRVSPNLLMDLKPGEVFVHRNIANLFLPDDMNSHSVLQFAVEGLRVNHVVVCGHYGCGGVNAALGPQLDGPLEARVAHIRSLAERHKADLDPLSSEKQGRRLAELNVAEQVRNVSGTAIVRRARQEGTGLKIHGLVFDLETGLLRQVT